MVCAVRSAPRCADRFASPLVSCREYDNRGLDIQAGSHIQDKGAIRAEVPLEEGHEGAEVLGREPPHPGWFTEHALNHQCMDIHHSVL